MRRPSPPRFWPVRRPRLVTLVIVLTAFVAGVVVIVATGAAVANLGTLLIGCVALGTTLAAVLDRRTVPD